MKAALKKQVDRLTKLKGMYIVVCRSDSYNEILMLLLKRCLKKEKRGIYATLNRTYASLSKELKEEGCNPKSLFFIDAVSKRMGASVKADNCAYVEGPNSLTELSLAILAAGQNQEMKFIVFDSLSALLMYNSPEISERFIHFLVNKIRSLNIYNVMIAVEDASTLKMMPTISQFCDGVIRIK